MKQSASKIRNHVALLKLPIVLHWEVLLQKVSVHNSTVSLNDFFFKLMTIICSRLFNHSQKLNKQFFVRSDVTKRYRQIFVQAYREFAKKRRKTYVPFINYDTQNWWLIKTPVVLSLLSHSSSNIPSKWVTATKNWLMQR